MAEFVCGDVFSWHKENDQTTQQRGRRLLLISAEKAAQVNRELFHGEEKLRSGDHWCTKCRAIAEDRLEAMMDSDSKKQVADIKASASGSACCEAAKSLDSLLKKLAEKYKQANHAERKLLLAVVPAPYTYDDTKEQFVVNSISQETSLKTESKAPAAKRGRREYSDEVVQLVAAFYRDPANSRLLETEKSSKAVRFEVASSQQPQRRLLRSLKDLYVLFKKRNPDAPVCPTGFGSLRPADCMLMGRCASGEDNNNGR